MPVDLGSLRIDALRLEQSLVRYARIGATAGGGVTRLALSVEDRDARDALASDLAAIGCQVTVDDLGNMTGTRAGSEDGPAVRMASHLDTVVQGGRFDGALGVLAGLEVLRTLHEAGVILRAPVSLTNWTNEEGARFQPAMLGSGTALGVFDPDATRNQVDSDGVRLGDELVRIGYAGESQNRPQYGAACLELHIEQGPVLDDAAMPVGLVEGIVGITWLNVTVRGESAHAGPTPMTLRRDAMAAAALMVSAAIEIGSVEGTPRAATVGRMTVVPNVINTIPGEVRFSVDFRAATADELDGMVSALEQRVEEIATDRDVSVAIDRYWTSSPVTFDPSLMATIERSCATVGVKPLRLWSGAGHDARYTADVMPTAMIFVRSRGGVSHCEAEFSDVGDSALAANVLLRTVIALAR